MRTKTSKKDGAKELYECNNCGLLYNHIEELKPLDIYSLIERVAPGEPFPAGECPTCGAFCHPRATDPYTDPVTLLRGIREALQTWSQCRDVGKGHKHSMGVYVCKIDAALQANRPVEPEPAQSKETGNAFAARALSTDEETETRRLAAFSQPAASKPGVKHGVFIRHGQTEVKLSRADLQMITDGVAVLAPVTEGAGRRAQKLATMFDGLADYAKTV